MAYFRRYGVKELGQYSAICYPKRSTSVILRGSCYFLCVFLVPNATVRGGGFEGLLSQQLGASRASLATDKLVH